MAVLYDVLFSLARAVFLMYQDMQSRLYVHRLVIFNWEGVLL